MEQHLFKKVNFLRGVAIIFVYLSHWYGTIIGTHNVKWVGQWPEFMVKGWQENVYISLLRIGSSGVALFFVLSGFCIHLSWHKNKNNFNILKFYLDRISRIYPPYLFFLIMFIFICDSPEVLNIFAHITLTHNIFTDQNTFLGINASYWFIPVLFQLYLLYPIFLYVYNRFDLNSAMLMTLSANILCKYGLPQTSPIDLQKLPILYWFYWSLGVYVADSWYLKKRCAFSNHNLLIAFLFPLLILSYYYLPLVKFSWWIRSIMAALILDRILFSPIKIKGIIMFFFVKIGIISYSLYLIHLPLLPILSSFILKNLHLENSYKYILLISVPSTLLILIPLSWISYKVIEHPSRHLARKLLDRKQVD